MRDSVRFIPGKGNPKANIMLVGEAPGDKEDLAGEPFVGASGKLLDEALKMLKWEREWLYITNVVKVRPKDNRAPTLDEIQSWVPLLLEEVERVNPVVIITLGATAARTFDSTIRISRDHGNTEEIKLNNKSYWVAPIFHPAYILRGYGTKADWFADLKKIQLENGMV
jgi:uracil-DNA glycosylase